MFDLFGNLSEGRKIGNPSFRDFASYTGLSLVEPKEFQLETGMYLHVYFNNSGALSNCIETDPKKRLDTFENLLITKNP